MRRLTASLWTIAATAIVLAALAQVMMSLPASAAAPQAPLLALTETAEIPPPTNTTVPPPPTNTTVPPTATPRPTEESDEPDREPTATPEPPPATPVTSALEGTPTPTPTTTPTPTPEPPRVLPVTNDTPVDNLSFWLVFLALLAGVGGFLARGYGRRS